MKLKAKNDMNLKVEVKNCYKPLRKLAIIILVAVLITFLVIL